ncbi:MAG: hypothetical protein AAF997_20705 [Myxococcota bacterium]
MNENRETKRVRFSSWMVLLGIASVAMGCGDATGSDGEVRVDLSGEEAATVGYPVGSGDDEIAFEDGFTMQFSKVLVAFERFSLSGADGASAELDADPIVADLSLGNPRGWVFDGVRSRRWEDVQYIYAPPTMESRNVNGVDEADLREMVENGYSIWVAGTASDGTESYEFDIRLPLRVLNVGCLNGVDETDGLVVPNNGVVNAEVTVHLDHFFFDTYASDDARLRFEAWAAVAGEDGVITLDDLASQSLSDLRDRNGDPIVDGNGLPVVYDPGPLEIAGSNLRDYTVAAATTTGHFNGEGHCDYITE